MYPGRLLHLIATCCCPADCERVFEPLIADLQHEWRTLGAPSHRIRALTLARGYLSFWECFVMVNIRTLVRDTLSPPSAEFTARAGAGFAMGLVGAIAIEFAGVFGHPHFGTSAITLLWASTRALMLAIPLGMLPALLFARARSGRAKSTDAVKVTIGAVLLTIVVAGWIAPFAQRKYTDENPLIQQETQITPAPRTAHLSPLEATWPTLVSFENENPWYPAELQRRAALVALTVALALFGWTLGAVSREHRARAVVWWAVAWLFTFFTQSQAAVSVTASWLPVVVFALAVVALKLLARLLPSPPALPAPPAHPAHPAR